MEITSLHLAQNLFSVVCHECAMKCALKCALPISFLQGALGCDYNTAYFLL